MACRPTLLQAICCADASAADAITTSEPTRCGYVMPHSSAVMPPIEPPTTDSQRLMPRCRPSTHCDRTMSRLVTTGKSGP